MERGLLDLSVQLSNRNITAGNEFALFVLATNPFDKPVWIREVNVSLPSELRLANEQEIEEKTKKEQERQRAISIEEKEHDRQIKGEIDILLNRLKELSEKCDNDQHQNNFARLRDLIEDWIITVKSRNELNVGVYDGAEVGTLKIGSNLVNVGIYGESEGGRATKVNRLEVYDSQASISLARTIKLKSSLPDGVALQPGSTVVYTVVLDVEKSLIFTPTQYRLQFNVNYSFIPETQKTVAEATEKEDEILTNTIAHELAIRPSVYSLIIGAMLGGFIGSSAKILQTTPTADWQNFTATNLLTPLVTVAVAVILSGMAIIFMARKSDAQSFVSIEDFWGGLLIGFLVGYTGTSFFENLTGISAALKK
jgi:hypothetical protein